MYTHFYELYKRVPRSRRKRLAQFIHRVKCLCGRTYHIALSEMLDQCVEDYLFIDSERLDEETASKLLTDVTALCDKYCIPREHIEDDDDRIVIFLYTDF